MSTALDTASIHLSVNKSQGDTKGYVIGSSAILAYTTANSNAGPSHFCRIACYAHLHSYRLQEAFLQG